MLKRTIFIIMMISALVVFSQESSFAITIGPSRFEVSLPQGEVAVADYYVQNETEDPIHVVVEPENWFKEAYRYGDLAVEDWLRLDIYEFDLQPKEIKKLQLRIRVPEDAEGELAAQIFFTSAVGGGEDKKGAVQARIGAVLYVAIKGTEIIDANIRHINISIAKENNVEKLKIAVKVRNKGNVHLRPTGKVFIKDSKGNVLSEEELMTGHSVLPNKDFFFYAYWDEPKLKKGDYSVSAEITYGEIFEIEKTSEFKSSFSINKNGEVILK